MEDKTNHNTKNTADATENWAKPESSVSKKIFEDFKNQKKVKVDEILEMFVSDFESDAELQKKFPDDLKSLRTHWNEFSNIFKKLLKNKKLDQKKL